MFIKECIADLFFPPLGQFNGSLVSGFGVFGVKVYEALVEVGLNAELTVILLDATLFIIFLFLHL